jgi:hypothetical protein
MTIRVARVIGVALLTLPLISGYQRFVQNVGLVGENMGRALGELQRPVALNLQRAAPDGGTPTLADPSFAPALASAEFVRGEAPKLPGKGMRSVLISEQTILRLANAGVIPQATPVPRQGTRPAGLQLGGVGAMGVGLQDGDVLFQVAGVPVSSDTQVAEIVRAARDRKVRSISARLWRNGETLALIVGMPYLDSSGKLKQ